MNIIRQFIRDRNKRDLVVLACGGIAALVSGIWAVFVYINPPDEGINYNIDSYSTSELVEILNFRYKDIKTQIQSFLSIEEEIALDKLHVEHKKALVEGKLTLAHEIDNKIEKMLNDIVPIGLRDRVGEYNAAPVEELDKAKDFPVSDPKHKP